VHELDMVVRADGRALALLAVPFTEFENTYFGGDLGGEFKIVDVTNPSAPTLLADWGVIADSSLLIVAGNDEVSSSFQGIGNYAAYYAHSARAADGGMTAYVLGRRHPEVQHLQPREPGPRRPHDLSDQRRR